MLPNPAMQKYEKLMYKITASFGFSDSESDDLVSEVSFYAHSHRSYPENRFLLRARLSKIMVHKCIFRISSRLFSQHTSTGKEPGILGYYPGCKSSPGTNCQDIPLSFRVVYILNDVIGFNEVEIAEILNITSIRVKDRLNKARPLLKNRSNDLYFSRNVFRPDSTTCLFNKNLFT
jgi:DNA-directed RNA polymerase specialized sigma24 family protein